MVPECTKLFKGETFWGKYGEHEGIEKRIEVAVPPFSEGGMDDVEFLNKLREKRLRTEVLAVMAYEDGDAQYHNKEDLLANGSPKLGAIEKRFEVTVPPFPEGGVDSSTYMATA